MTEAPDDLEFKLLDAQSALLELSDIELARALRRLTRLVPEILENPWVAKFVLDVTACVVRFGSFKGEQHAKALQIAAQCLAKLWEAGRLGEWGT